MIVPLRAPVRPRVLSPETGEAVPLEDEILALLDAGTRGPLRLLGPPGAGKSTALAHLAAVLPPGVPVAYRDDVGSASEMAGVVSGLVLYAGRFPVHGQPGLHLSAWGDDDALEYLLAVHREECASVMRRLRSAPDRDLLDATPEIWRVVLDEMAADTGLLRVQDALRRFIEAQVPDPELQRVIRRACIYTYSLTAGSPRPDLPHLAQEGCPAEVLRLLRHQPWPVVLAADQIVRDAHDGKRGDYLVERLSLPLVRRVGAAIAADEAAIGHLHRILRLLPHRQAMCASILHAAGTSWCPPPDLYLRLDGAYLGRAAWPGVVLRSVSLRAVDLGGADLSGAVLEKVDALRANLRGADLHGASLSDANFSEAMLARADLTSVRAKDTRMGFADLTGAILNEAVLAGCDLGGANLTGAQFRGADLEGAMVAVTSLENADFTGANLRGANLAGVPLNQARFTGAGLAGTKLLQADLEGMFLPGADFEGADLTGALLTGSVIPAGNFQRATLHNTGLADVHWERANLRGADLRGATFHLGSSRSGLLFTPIASEGTRTGFYTDDYEEQSFKRPEEIRKANLCGADLRGARIDDVDFYLVDLRGAVFDPDQGRHFRRCRAILEDRG